MTDQLKNSTDTAQQAPAGPQMMVCYEDHQQIEAQLSMLSQQVTVVTVLIRGYHIAGFISAHISSPSVNNCPGRTGLSIEGLM